MAPDTYRALAAHFDKHHKDPRGFEHLTGEQVVTRLNEVLGPGGWSFVVKDYGYDAESDEVWAIGHLEASIDGLPVVREQFGSQRHNRRKAAPGARGDILDYGFDSKGAATDAMKKCATLIGVGLYLSEKQGGVVQQEARTDVDGAGPKTGSARPAASPPRGTHLCTNCTAVIVAQDGQPINGTQADIIRDRYGKLVCRDCRPKKAAAAAA